MGTMRRQGYQANRIRVSAGSTVERADVLGAEGKAA